MARIRTIKPDFFTSEDIMALSPLARLLYIGTWLDADREGRLAWKLNTLKIRYLPSDACDVSVVAKELTDRGLIVPYGDCLAFIPSFAQHQVINPREAASKLAEPVVIEDRRVLERRVSDASLLVSDAPSLPSVPSHSLPSRPLAGKRNLNAEYEHPRFDVPTSWHLRTVKGLANGESRLMQFYRWLAERVERTNEDTLPRFEWLDGCFKEWLATAAPQKSQYPTPAETTAMIKAREAMADPDHAHLTVAQKIALVRK